MSAPTFWPLGSDGYDDPFAAWATQQSAAPLREVPERGIWVATGYREVSDLFREGRCAPAPVPSAEQLGAGVAARGMPLHRTLERMASLSGEPRHARVRRPVQRAFLPAVVRPWRGHIRALADELLDGRADGPFEVVEGFARPLVGIVLDDMLRLPRGEGEAIRQAWRHAATPLDRPQLGDDPQAPRAVLDVHERLARLLRRVRAQPESAPIDVFMQAADEDPDLTEGDLIANLIFVLTSGHRSAAQGLALAIHSLLRHPDELDRLRREQELIPGAVEELLRFDGSVPMVTRLLLDDVRIDGHAITAGRLVVLLGGAANRDSTVFADADRLDVTRARSARHMSFGRGSHLCVGAALSRMLLQEALAALVEHAQRMDATSPPAFTRARRGLERLEVNW